MRLRVDVCEEIYLIGGIRVFRIGYLKGLEEGLWGF